MAQKAFVATLKDLYGYRPGTSAADFMKEYKALSVEDKQWFYEEFKKQGFDVLKPGVTMMAPAVSATPAIPAS